MDDLIELRKYLFVSLVRKLQSNTMAGCGIQAKEGKKRNRNIKGRIFRTIQNVVKKPGSIVGAPRVYSFALGDLQTIILRGYQMFSY